MIIEPAQLFMTTIVAFLSIVGWLIARTLKQIDNNQQTLFDRLHKVEIDISELKAHNKLLKIDGGK